MDGEVIPIKPTDWTARADEHRARLDAALCRARDRIDLAAARARLDKALDRARDR